MLLKFTWIKRASTQTSEIVKMKIVSDIVRKYSEAFDVGYHNFRYYSQ